MSKILRYSDKFTTIDDNSVSNDFSYKDSEITLIDTNILKFESPLSGAVVNFDVTTLSNFPYSTASDVQKYIQGWINEYKDNIEDESGVLFLRETLEQIPLNGRLQNIGGDLYWEGEPVCIGEDCGGGGGLPDGTLDRNILVWDETAGVDGEWVEWLVDGSALMGPYNFYINQKMDEQNFDLKGFWTAGDGVLEFENAFLGIYTDPANSDRVLGFRMGTSFYEIEDDPASFVKGASLGYHKDNGSAENQWITYYNSASTDLSALSQQTIILTASDTATGTRADFLVTDGVDNPQIEQRIGTASEPTQLQVLLGHDRSVNFRQHYIQLIDEINADPDLDFYSRVSLTRQPGANSEFSVKLSRENVDFLIVGNKEGGSLPTGPVGVNESLPGCIALVCSDITIPADLDRTVIVCASGPYSVNRNKTFYSYGGLVESTVLGTDAYETDPVNVSIYEKIQNFLIDPDPDGGVTFQLPDTSLFEFGRIFTIKNVGTVQTVSVTPSGSDTIDGVNAVYPLTTMQSITIVNATVNGWYILSKLT